MPGFGPIANGPIASISSSLSASITETALPTDALSLALTAAASVTETASASEAISIGIGVSIAEAASASDDVSIGFEGGAIVEAATATEIVSNVFSATASVTETASADGAESTVAIVAVTDAATATDTVTATAPPVSVSLVEAATATDTVSYPAPVMGLVEAATATDTLDTVLYARWDYLPTVISQYRNSPILMDLLDYYSQWIDQDYDVTQFYLLMWNIDTAAGYGLDVWGRIVGVDRTLQVLTGTFFEFDQQEQISTIPFGGGPFFSGNTSTENFILSDAAFRQLILAKALSNICGGSIPEINKILMFLFPDMGNCYVTDGEDMTMEFVFGAPLSPAQYAIISQTGVLPRPVGVAASIVQP